MENFLTYVGIALFVGFFFGFCIFIHELGHFLAAKWRGLHINAFSIGFKKVWSYKHKGIEYRIGCLPFGGYVDLPQIDSTGEAKAEDGTPLEPAKPIDKIITAFAGPLFNVLFGFALASLIWWHGIEQRTPRMKELEVASVEAGSPEYNAGLRKGDVIVGINGEKFNGTWVDFIQKIIFTIGDVTLNVKDVDGIRKITYTPEENKEKMPTEALAYPFFSPKLPVVLYPQENSAAQAAGILPGDVVISVNGEEVNDSHHFISLVGGFEAKKLNIKVQRGEKVIDIPEFSTKPKADQKPYYAIGVRFQPYTLFKAIVPKNSDLEKMGFKNGDFIRSINGEELNYPEDLNDVLGKLKEDGKDIDIAITRGTENINLKVASSGKSKAKTLKIKYKYIVTIDSIFDNFPGAKSGLQKGDVVVEVNGEKLNNENLTLVTNAVKESKGKEVVYSIVRKNSKHDIKVKPIEVNEYGIGASLVFINHPTPWQQFTKVISMSYKTLRSASSPKSTVKPSNMSGPLGIVRAISISVYHGSIWQGFNLIVIITFSLGLLNLMPIPVLDGGHICLSLFQMIFKRPLPSKIIQPVTLVFAVLLIGFMLYVTKFDFDRVVGDLSKPPNGTVIYIQDSKQTEEVKAPETKPKEGVDDTKKENTQN